MKTTAFITRLEGGRYALVLWGGRRAGVWQTTFGNAMAAAFTAVWTGRAESVWLDQKRVW